MPGRSATNREIEVKLRITNLRALIRRLARLRARPGARIFEENTLYDTPEADFRSRGRLLRLRLESSAPPGRLRRHGPRRTVLTAKAPSALGPARASARRFKERLEREQIVRNSRGWGAKFCSLGLRPGFHYTKYRTTFRISGLHLDLDETPIGTFLELEGSRAAINHASRVLGFAPQDYIQATYWDLYAAECRRRGRRPGNMVFCA